MENTKLDLYTDYLLSTFGAAPATDLSAMLDGAMSDDKITRFLSDKMYTFRELWMKVKQTVKSLKDDKAVLIIDDTIQEKPGQIKRSDVLALRSLYWQKCTRD